MTDHRPSLLEKILPLVPFDGWSEITLAQAGKSIDLSARDIKAAFPRGPIDCIDYFFDSADDALKHAFPNNALAQMRVPDRIERLILARLDHLVKHQEAVRRALAFYALPWNVLHGLQSLYRTVDVIWRLAGDKSLDFNFYTKRATLAGVCSATTVFWLNDNSENQSGTAEFLKRRLGDVAAFGKMKKDLASKFKMA